MLQEERHHFILNQVNLHHKVVTTDLCRQLNVSLDTIRRDLQELEKAGKLLKVHGGALSRSFPLPFQQPEVHAAAEKKAIAKKALRFIQNGMVVLTGGGTVMLELARIIPKDLDATFFTVSPLVALEIAQCSPVKVILVGGQLTHDSYICTGASVVSQLAEIKADLCFLGTNGLSVKEGITEHDWDVALVKKAMIQSALKTVILSISEKLNSVQHMKLCTLKAVDYLVTELNPHDHQLHKYSKVVKVK